MTAGAAHVRQDVCLSLAGTRSGLDPGPVRCMQHAPSTHAPNRDKAG